MKKHKRYSKSKILDFLNRFQSSELSKRQFCRKEDLVPSTFYNWKKKYSGELTLTENRNEPPSFIPIHLQESTGQRSSSYSPIEINFPNGVQMRCTSEIDFDQLKKLIQ